jgi:hypothetical protein
MLVEEISDFKYHALTLMNIDATLILMLERIPFMNKLIFICTYVIGCVSCCPEDISSQALEAAYKNAKEVAWGQSDVVRELFPQLDRKAEPEVGKVYMFGETKPARFSNTFAQYTGEEWQLVYVYEVFGDDSKPAFY